MQRILDIVFSLTAIIVFSPILLMVILLLRFTGEGEVFFIQNRIGKAGKLIRILKFATMLKDSPNFGTGTVTVKDDPRILPVGRFLRASKINEMPQLLNILIGDMSIVGPRPQTLRCFEAFSPTAQKKIKSVRPGLSGIGSIFFRNEEEMLDNADDADHFYNSVIMKYKGDLEIWYVQNKSIVLYFKIIYITIFVVLFKVSPKKFFVMKNFPPIPEALRMLIR